MPSLNELLEQSVAIDREITRMQTANRANAIAQIHAIMKEHGLTLHDLQIASQKSRGAPVKATRSVSPKYRDSATGQTWSGRGLKPRWLVSALAAGKSLEDFTINIR